jgi:hypothetical protein
VQDQSKTGRGGFPDPHAFDRDANAAFEGTHIVIRRQKHR